MSLLPIIYTSLVLFFGILLFIVVVSYMSFRMKKNKNPVIEAEIRRQKKLIIPQRIIENNTAFPLTPAPIAQTIVVKRSSSQPIKESLVRRNFDRENINIRSEYEPARVKYTQEKRNYNYDSNQQLGKTYNSRRMTRMEITNESVYPQAKNYQNQNDKIQKTMRMDASNYDILNFYSDNPKNNYVSVPPLISKQAI